MAHGGRRSHSGRKSRERGLRIGCSVPRRAYEELCAREHDTGVYRTRIAATILCDELIGGMIDREPSGR